MRNAFSLLMAAFFSSVALADVTVSDLQVRELLPGRSMTAGYMSLMNNGSSAVDLVAVSSSAFADIELHEHVHSDGMMKMQQLDKVHLEPGQQVIFQPGGLHLMLFDAKAGLKVGQAVPMRLQFSDGAVVEQQATVVAIAN